jgi:hypothetical protein
MEQLVDLRKKHPEDFRKLEKVLALVGMSSRVLNFNHVKQCKRYREIYEMRGGCARLFFFYTRNDEVVVCTNSYWKSKPSRAEQDEAFEKADVLRQRYLRSLQE